MKKTTLVGIVAAAVGFVAISGCNSDNSTSWDGPLNADGFPQVAGNYSLTTSDIVYNCSDGSVGQLVGTTFDVAVQESGSTLTMTDTEEVLPLNASIVSQAAATGDIGGDASFALTKVLPVEVSGETELVPVTYDITGTFTTSGASGDYNFTAEDPNSGVTCIYTATFSADLLGS